MCHGNGGHDVTPLVKPMEVVFFVYVSAVLLDGMVNDAKKKKLGVKTSSTVITMAMNLRMNIFFVACIVRLLSCFLAEQRVAVPIYHLYIVLLSVNAFLVAFGLLQFLSQWRKLGVLVIMFDAMIKNSVAFLLLYVVFLLGFSLLFVGLDAIGSHKNSLALFADFQGGEGGAAEGFVSNIEAAINTDPLHQSWLVPLWGTYVSFPEPSLNLP